MSAYSVIVKRDGKMRVRIPMWQVWMLLVIVLGVFNTGIGCYLFFSKLEKLPVQTVSILGYLEPLSAVALSVIILGESLTFIQTTGAVLIIGGAVYAEK